MRLHAILFVADQTASARFYRQVFAAEPRLDVSGMTEFEIGAAVLGLMPEGGIRRLLGEALPDPAESRGCRGEVYVVVEDPEAYHRRALATSARELSALAPRDWGHRVAYSLDPDGYVLAFASETRSG